MNALCILAQCFSSFKKHCSYSRFHYAIRHHVVNLDGLNLNGTYAHAILYLGEQMMRNHTRFFATKHVANAYYHPFYTHP